MEQWEYHTAIIWAHEDNPGAREYVVRHRPGEKVGKFSPVNLVPELDRLGKQGWELVTLQPIVMTADMAIMLSDSTPQASNVYFVAMKRRVR